GVDRSVVLLVGYVMTAPPEAGTVVFEDRRGNHPSLPVSRLFRRASAGQRLVRVPRLPRRLPRRRAPGHRPTRGHLHPVASNLRTERHAGHHHARRHLLRLAIWRLYHLDLDAHPW